MKVALCIPTYKAPAHAFLASSLQMAITAQKERPDLTIWPVVIGNVPLISMVRNDIAASALDWGADWLLWLDNDHNFPPHTLQRLLNHKKPIVGANYLCRHGATKPVAHTVAGEPVTSAGRTGIEEIGSLGLGICLVAREVFDKVPKPWFALRDAGEDYGFFVAAREAGFPVHVDHDLSRECGHVVERLLTF